MVFAMDFMNTDLAQRIFFSITLFIISIVLMIQKDTHEDEIPVDKDLLVISIISIGYLVLSEIIRNSALLLFNDMFRLISALSCIIILILCYKKYGIEMLLRAISSITVVVSLAVSLIGISQAFGIKYGSIPVVTLPGSTFAGSNFAAEYIVLSLPFNIAGLFLRNQKTFRAINHTSIIISLWYLFLLRSRAAYLAFAVGAAVGIYLFSRLKNKVIPFRHYKKQILYGVTVLITALSLGIIETEHLYRKGFLETLSNISPQSPLSQSRVKYFHASWQMFLEKPLTGIGSSMWSGIIPQYIAEDYRDDNVYFTDSINPHNDYAEYLSENGIFYFLLYIAFVGLVIKRLLQKSIHNPVLIFVVVSLTSFLVLQLFAFPKDRTAPMLYFIAASSMAFAFTEKTVNVPSGLIGPALVAASGLNLIFVVMVGRSELDYRLAMEKKFAGEYRAMLTQISGIHQYIYPMDQYGMPLSYYRGVGEYSIGDYQNACRSFQDASNIAPHHPLVLVNVAAGYYRTGQNQKAESLYQYLTMKYPNYHEPQINYAALLANKGNDSGAIRIIRTLDTKNGKGNLFLQIKEYYHGKGMY